MQLSHLYSSASNLFDDISFNSLEHANTLNVVFARVTKPKARERDSHNLGKTTLVYLIDFCLLRSTSGDSEFFLVKHAGRFNDGAFFLEVATKPGAFVTIRRAVNDQTKIGLKFHDKPRLDFRKLPPDQWDHWDVAIDPAREILDAHLNLAAITPWDYRKGIFARLQGC
jgi:uncharacterized protein YydD (DUF2326 family)